eukprot:854497-Pelagomonas_calceolata.AAC.1
MEAQATLDGSQPCLGEEEPSAADGPSWAWPTQGVCCWVLDCCPPRECVAVQQGETWAEQLQQKALAWQWRSVMVAASLPAHGGS